MNFSWHLLTFFKTQTDFTEKSSKIEWEQNFLKWIECEKWIFFIIQWIRWKIYNFYHHWMEKCEDWNFSFNKKLSLIFWNPHQKLPIFLKYLLTLLKGRTFINHIWHGRLQSNTSSRAIYWSHLDVIHKIFSGRQWFFWIFLVLCKKLFLWLNCWK